MAKKCDGWCWPAVIYVTLAAVSLLLTLMQDLSHLGEHEGNFRIAVVVFHVLMALFWTWVLYWLCTNCQNVAAWIILFLPVFVGLVALAIGTVTLSAWMVGRGVEAGVQEAGHAAGHVASGAQQAAHGAAHAAHAATMGEA